MDQGSVSKIDGVIERTPYTAIAVGGGNVWDGYRDYIRGSSLNIAADGGFRIYFYLGIMPDILVGDLDSLNPEEIEVINKSKITVLKHPREKDKTDSHLAIDIAIEKGISNILILAGLGRRIDHTLTNLHLIKYGRDCGAHIRIIDPCNEVTLIGEGENVSLTRREGENISLIPLTHKVSGVTLKGFRWEMERAELKLGDSLGVSNELIAPEGSVSVEQGLVFLMRTKDG